MSTETIFVAWGGLESKLGQGLYFRTPEFTPAQLTVSLCVYVYVSVCARVCVCVLRLQTALQ